MSDECQCICHRLEAGLGMHHAVDCCSLSGVQGKRYRELLAAEQADGREPG